MASSYDEEFDWEAAVKEIDDACERIALPSIADDSVRDASEICDSGLGNKKVSSFPKQNSSGGARQSTLDGFGFVGNSKKFGDVCRSGSNTTAALDDGENVYAGIDPETAKTWIYPVNVPLRDYQFSIVKTALFSNTLVALPTGLGKTLIAAVVMYNYFRWFPRGKIVFAAPSRPLVMQQIEACHNIVGIPQEWTIDMTGQMSPSKRSSFWETKRVFFVTPQVLEKDIHSGRCLVRQFVCLVIDEAHRAMGNYSYCIAVHELMGVPVQLRILALTATPGAKQHTIQNVIDNLHISVLEYRNESDHDVRKYMHNRQLELIEVAVGNDAVKINDLLLEAIQPFVSRLCVLGVLQHRDLSTFSPCALLSSRDKFRQSPPANLPQVNYGEVEGYFGVLITLYYIRKLLSSHGVRPAYEMLHEKMQQGTFAKLMGRNEALWNAKLLMEKSLAHGAPNPKLLKLLEVLTDHFKAKDPQQSRVIIFSNYRGSVRDIMQSLSNLGDFVKATEFIGQSSGKSLKGQSQKVQQAVLQKFRTGGYNVIVATSIGEEGLDIMEVDLVICFDANISPLRMIQRMGRTGRKHHGRVVILACEGNELKGYLNKQAKAKAVGKHMHNGGTESFSFHGSPRMVPHIYKPEVQFVELSIEKFVPRGRKVKEESVKKVTFLNLSVAETELLAKYFHSTKEEKWKPSLIAFPHFQVLPSGVYHVRHSYRTTRMLIDSMQLLQEVESFNTTKPISNGKVRASVPCVEAVSIPQSNLIKGEFVQHDIRAFSESKVGVQASVSKALQHNFQQCISGISCQSFAIHRFLFGTNFVSVTAVGSICISYVPSLPFSKAASSFKDSLPVKGWEMKTLKQENSLLMVPSVENSQNKDARHAGNATGTLNFTCNSPVLAKPDADDQECLVDIKEIVPQTPIAESKPPMALVENAADKHGSFDSDLIWPISDLKNLELSPRLTNFIEKGVVPETPIAEPVHEFSAPSYVPNPSLGSKKGGCNFSVYDPSPSCIVPKCSAKLFNSPETIQSPAAASFLSDKPELCMFRTSTGFDSRTANSRGVSEVQTVACTPTPTKKHGSNSCSEEWQLASADASNSVQKPCRLKRLRRYGDIENGTSVQTMGKKCNKSGTSLFGDLGRVKSVAAKLRAGTMSSKSCINNFIEEEAEVSSDVGVSEDEQEDDEYPESSSFIDDRLNPTAATTQAEASELDMMAFYRRSLLTQSPLEGHVNFITDTSSSIVTVNEYRSVATDSCQKSFGASPRLVEQSTSSNQVSCELGEGRMSVNALASEAWTVLRKKTEGKMDTRKRKLSYQPDPFLHAADICLEGNGPINALDQNKYVENHNGTFFDDQFYEGLDLDEIEAKATEMLQLKSELANEQQFDKLEPSLNIKEGYDVDIMCSPSFDLGV